MRHLAVVLLAAVGAWWLLSGASGRAVRSVEAQTLGFFARPHDGLPSAPLSGPSVWRGSELANREGDWREVRLLAQRGYALAPYSMPFCLRECALQLHVSDQRHCI